VRPKIGPPRGSPRPMIPELLGFKDQQVKPEDPLLKLRKLLEEALEQIKRLENENVGQSERKED